MQLLVLWPGLALLLFIHLISISFIERAWGNKGRRRVVDGDLSGHYPTFAWLSFMTNICNQIILSVGMSILHSWVWYQELCHVHPPEKHTKHWWFNFYGAKCKFKRQSNKIVWGAGVICCVGRCILYFQ